MSADTDSTIRPARPTRHRTAAGVAAVIVSAVALVAMPFSSHDLGANPGFMPAFGATAFFADLMTAVLLFSQAKTTGNRGTAYLGVAYAISVISIVPHLLSFPGVFVAGSVIGSSASAVWMWAVWHTGFALGICCYALGPQTERQEVRLWPMLLPVASIILVLSTLVTAGQHLLPDVLQGDSFAAMQRLGIGPMVVVCNAAALTLVIWKHRARTALASWVTVAMVAAVFDVLLTNLGGARYTLGWYLARCLSLATATTVLIALLSELLGSYSQTAEANRQLRVLSMTDGLTRMLNRRAFDRSIQKEWRRAIRDRTALSLLIIDIDFFKTFNDLYGHLRGDECLRQVANCIHNNIRRPGDIAARIGGEEFAVLLPATDADGATRVASTFHAAVAALHLAHDGSPLPTLTISIGIATILAAPGALSPLMFIEQADQALYQAKRNGRNRTCHFTPTLPPARLGQSQTQSA